MLHKWRTLFLLALSLFSVSEKTHSAELKSFGKSMVQPLPALSPLRLINWNFYKGAKPGAFRDLQDFTLQADWVLLQEFLLSPTYQGLIQQKNHQEWHMSLSFRDQGHWTGVALTSRWASDQVIPLRSQQGEPFTGTPKTALVAYYPLAQGGRLALATFHGLNFNLDFFAYKEQLDAVMDELKTHPGPVIFAGDFNNWYPGRWEYLLIKTKDIHLERIPLDSPTGPLHKTLDHIFHRGLIHVQGAVLQQYQSSDHSPLEIQFQIPMTP